ncbi:MULTISPECIES: universal stress protein [unclassified Streptomyces]|uniref:universal stress protein n=1 Tax=unclassified Streptomyces TaxID=2593676 RepID=UPI0033BCFB67
MIAFEASPAGDAALAFSVEMAERLGARLHVIHVTDLADYPIDPDLAGSALESNVIRKSSEHRRAEVDRLLADFGGEWTYTDETGNVVDRIKRVARRYDALAIILGSSAPGLAGTLHRSLKGSVLRDLTRHSDRVVMVVPARPPPD